MKHGSPTSQLCTRRRACWQASIGLRPSYVCAQYNNQLLQLFTSSLFIAGLLAGLVATVPTRQLGRRATMLVSRLPMHFVPPY